MIRIRNGEMTFDGNGTTLITEFYMLTSVMARIFREEGGMPDEAILQLCRDAIEDGAEDCTVMDLSHLPEKLLSRLEEFQLEADAAYEDSEDGEDAGDEYDGDDGSAPEDPCGSL